MRLEFVVLFCEFVFLAMMITVCNANEFGCLFFSLILSFVFDCADLNELNGIDLLE